MLRYASLLSRLEAAMRRQHNAEAVSRCFPLPLPPCAPAELSSGAVAASRCQSCLPSQAGRQALPSLIAVRKHPSHTPHTPLTNNSQLFFWGLDKIHPPEMILMVGHRVTLG